MWLGPPSMNRKMQLLAFARWCGSRTASGWRGLISGTSARASSAIIAARAKPPKPRPAFVKNSRRVVGHIVWGGRIRSSPRLEFQFIGLSRIFDNTYHGIDQFVDLQSVLTSSLVQLSHQIVMR